jgi:hypothetical protein
MMLGEVLAILCSIKPFIWACRSLQPCWARLGDGGSHIQREGRSLAGEVLGGSGRVVKSPPEMGDSAKNGPSRCKFVAGNMSLVEEGGVHQGCAVAGPRKSLRN